MSKRLIRVVAGFFFLAGIQTGLAHDTWLMPSTFAASVGETVKFRLTSGMEFPFLDTAIRSERVTKTGLRLSDGRAELGKFTTAAQALEFDHTFTQAGVATIWLQLSPKEITLTDAEVAHYLEEIQAPETVRRASEAQKGIEQWKELYTKCAKTCLAIGDQSDDSWRAPVGLALELVPLSDPIALRQNEEAKFRLLHNGEPLAGPAVILHYENERDAVVARPGPDGVVAFRFPKSGAALLSCVYLRADATSKNWQSEFTTLTLSVKTPTK